MKRQWGEMNRKSRRELRLYPVFDLLLQRDFVHSKLRQAQWLTPVSIAIKQRGDEVVLLAAKLPCQNHRRKKEFDGWQSTDTALWIRLNSRVWGTTLITQPPFILTWQTSASAPRTTTASCTCCQCVVTICNTLWWRSYSLYEDETEWEMQRKETAEREAKGSQSIGTAHKEPRAMNLINSAMWKPMLFMLRVGVWIIEIRVCCLIRWDSQSQRAYYLISSRDIHCEWQRYVSVLLWATDCASIED